MGVSRFFRPKYMATIGSFIIIFLITFLVFLLYRNIFENISLEFIIFLTFLSVTVMGLFLFNMGVELLPNDLAFFSVSLFFIYLIFWLGGKIVRKKESTKISWLDGLVDNIYKNREEIFKKIDEEENLEGYFYLKVEYEKGNVKSEKFQKEYRKFYSMQLFGFTREFYNKYFQFLEEAETDLRKILKELSEIKNKNGKKSVQLAFATKIIHFVDNDLPLYNSMVGRVFNLTLAKGTIEEKIDSSMEIYEKLKSYHRALSNREKIKETMTEFREKSSLQKGILSDRKLLDFLIKGSQNL